MPAKDAGRGLTAGAFASLLTRLGPDAERAGSAYEHLRRALVSFFAWRGAATPEDCANETLDRLATRLDDGVAVEDVPRFARGIARMGLRALAAPRCARRSAGRAGLRSGDGAGSTR